MPDMIAGFPFWTLGFDEEGRPRNSSAVEDFVSEVAKERTDLFIFSHGWNNDETMAMALYSAFLGEMRKLLEDPGRPRKRPARLAAAGIVWPSIKWPDDGVGGEGAAALQGDAPDLFGSLETVFSTTSERAELKKLEQLLDEREGTPEALGQFRQALTGLLGSAPEAPGLDDVESSVLSGPGFQDVLEALAPEGDSEGGAAGLGDTFDRLWGGAKNALRVATYWKMKKRAGVVGREGLGPLIGRLRQESKDLRVHLLGHSFGARLVSYALAGLPASALRPSSPVKSVFLLQGAFSHFTFASVLPFDASRGGDLAGMAGRVDGPLLTTHSRLDTAVGAAYPAAQVLVGEDAAGLGDVAGEVLFRFGAMGADGAQAVNAKDCRLGAPGAQYPFATGQWLNLDGNEVIVKGGPPSGSHSDIVHPHTAWAALAAAGIL